MPDRPTRLLIDCDGVLADFMGAVLPLIERLLGRPFDPTTELTTWDLFEAPAILPIAHELRACIDAPGFCLDFALLPGGAEGLARVRELTDDVVCVTSPWSTSRTWAHDRTEWLISKLDFTRDKIDHSRGKYRIDGDVFVDDHANNVVTWLNWDRRHHHAAVLWAQDYNANDWDALQEGDAIRNHHVHRHSSWDALVELIRTKGYVR